MWQKPRQLNLLRIFITGQIFCKQLYFVSMNVKMHAELTTLETVKIKSDQILFFYIAL